MKSEKNHSRKDRLALGKPIFFSGPVTEALLPTPLELSGHVFLGLFQSFKKSSFILVARPLPPLPICGRANIKNIAASLKELFFPQFSKQTFFFTTFLLIMLSLNLREFNFTIFYSAVIWIIGLRLIIIHNKNCPMLIFDRQSQVLFIPLYN